MQVYRFENEAGVGPYQNCLGMPYENFLAVVHNPFGIQGKLHPLVDEDVIGFKRPMLSGTTSVAALRRWFWRCWTQIEEEGFLVAVYEVPDADVLSGISGRQVAFYREGSERTQYAPLREVVRKEKTETPDGPKAAGRRAAG